MIIEHSRLFSVLFVPFVFFVLRFPPAQNQSFNTEVSARRTCNQTQLQCLKRTERNFTSARLKPNPPSRSGNSARGATKVRISNTYIRREKGLSRAFTGGFAVSECIQDIFGQEFDLRGSSQAKYRAILRAGQLAREQKQFLPGIYMNHELVAGKSAHRQNLGIAQL